MRLALAVVVVLALGGEASGQGGPSWEARGDTPNGVNKEGADGKDAPEARGEPASRTRTAEPEGVFDRLVDFFLGERPGESERTWGFVPLVVAETNAGFGGGIQFVERRVLGSRVGVEVNSTVTTERFFDGEIRLRGPPLARLEWEVFGEYSNRPRLFFFGIGNETDRDDRLSLGLEETYVQGRVGLEVLPRTFLFAIGKFANVNARDGEHENVPPVSTRHDETTLTGFSGDGLTNGAGGALVVDLRDDPLFPTFGARVEVRAVYHGPELGDRLFRFTSYVADSSVYLPFLRDPALVLALAARSEHVDASLAEVPFYALPSLGGTRSLRGFRDGRFRDRNSVLFQAEIRFPIWRVVSGAFFADAGRVFPEFTRPNLSGKYHADAGVGIRLVIKPDIFTRLDFALSPEELTFALEFGYPF